MEAETSRLKFRMKLAPGSPPGGPPVVILVVLVVLGVVLVVLDLSWRSWTFTEASEVWVGVDWRPLNTRWANYTDFTEVEASSGSFPVS